MSSDEIIYVDEDIPEIEYYELVSMEDLIKENPNFIAFSKEEIYNEIFNFVKEKSKSENFLKLFYEIINRNKMISNNFIIVADADRGNFEEEDIAEFISNLKKYDKMNDIDLAFKSKNKLWFPLNYSIDNKLTFKAEQKTVIEISENNNYIIFKDDERNIPILGVYLYSPVTILEDYLNDKIMSHLNSPLKLETLSSDGYKEFEDLINDYKIELPLDKIDIDNYNYSSINLLLQKYNYNLDNISIDDLNKIKTYLENLQKSEKPDKIVYAKIKNEKAVIHNPRYTFFNIMKEVKSLVDLTLKSVDSIAKSLKGKSKTATKNIELSLFSLVSNIDDKNYNEIISNLRELRINMNIDVANNALENFKANNKKTIIEQLDELETRFELLKYSFTDIYKLTFDCHYDEHEISVGADESKYEGNPKKVQEIVNEENKVIEGDIDVKEDKDEEINLEKYYTNQLYNSEAGFAELLKMALPFINKMHIISGLPLNYDMLTTHLFNKFRTFEPKATLIKKFIPNIDNDELEIYMKKQIKYILIEGKDNIKIINAINEYFDNFKNVIYEVIAYWSVKLQKAIVEGTLFIDFAKMSPECDHLWEDYGIPYDMTAKNGVTVYLNCIFREVYGDVYKDEYANLIELTDDYKKIIYDKINENPEIEVIRKVKNKEKKINIGRKYYDTLYDLLKRREYKGNQFLKAYIDALIYMPTINSKKIHKYLQGCCLERIDENFSADLYLKSERHDLKKAKEKLMGERVFNMPRYKRYYLKKKIIKDKIKLFERISNPIKYDLKSVELEVWLENLKDMKKTKTVFTKDLIDKLLMSVYKTTDENYKDIPYFNDKDLKPLINNYNFENYKQIGIGVSKILYKYLKSMDYITIINNTINELDKLNGVVDNITDIINIRKIAIIRIMALPAVPENAINKKLVPAIDIPNYTEIMKEIVDKVKEIIKNAKMFNQEEQIDFINKIREQNKVDILARMNKKSREDKEIEKELKKYGLQYQEEEDFNEDVNNNPNSAEIDGENEYTLSREDEDDDDEFMDKANYGFIYAD
jgi:hypothetical protein